MKAISLYEKDFFAWTQEQAQLIKDNLLGKLDLIHLREELNSMGASEKRELGHRLEKLLMHLLKWKYQPNLQCRSWKLTVKEQRKKLSMHLKDNPSLTNPETFAERFSAAYDTAVLKAAQETGLDEDIFPEQCEWTIEQILDNNFLPN